MIVCMSGGSNRSSCKDTSSALLRVTVTVLERGEKRGLPSPSLPFSSSSSRHHSVVSGFALEAAKRISVGRKMVAEVIEMMEVVEMHQVAKVEIYTCEDEVTFEHLLWRCQLVFVDDTSSTCHLQLCSWRVQFKCSGY
jgi:hypothetical protein